MIRHLQRFAGMALLACALAGCGFYDAKEALNPLVSPFTGMGFPDLVDCMGPWDSWHQTDQDRFDVTWQHTDNSAGLKLSLALLGSISAGGGGGCKVNITVMRDGTVVGLQLPGSYSNGLVSVPYETCRPMLTSCLQQHPKTRRSADYDLAAYLNPAPAGGAAHKP